MKELFLLVVATAILWSCSKDPVETVYFDFDTSQGVFIACEGNFMSSNGSLSFYHTGDKKVANRIFYARNNVPLGDVVQSLNRYDDKLFIVVNNSGKVVSVDAVTVEFKGNITGLSSPRYIHIVSEQKAYISDLHANELTVFNPSTLDVTGSVGLNGYTAEQMVQIGDYVYASHWSYGQSILVIDTRSDELVAEMEVPLQPKDLAVDINGKLWVFSDGGYEGSPSGNEAPAISRIDTETQTIEQIYRFNANDAPSHLKINGTGDTVYFLNRHVYKMHVESRQLPDSAFLKSDIELFYNLSIDPLTNDVYVANAIDYTQDAIVFRYSQTGKLIDKFKTGINPSDFRFR